MKLEKEKINAFSIKKRLNMNNIIGVGTDIESVIRFKDASFDTNKTFYQKIFTPTEIEQCLKKPNPNESFAARFAAKEAIIKATPIPVFFSQIEITSEKSPNVILHGPQFKNIKIELSISHTKEFALAFAIAIEK